MANYIREMNRLRGLGILLVVFGHAIFIDMIHTTDVSTVGLYKYVRSFIYSFHMPLFFLISGFFSIKALQIHKIQEYYVFITEKFKKLMVPYLILTIIATIIKLILATFSVRTVELSTLVTTILFYPWDNPMKLLWYIYTLFFIFALLPLVSKIPFRIRLLVLFVLNLLPFSYGEIINFNGIIRYMFYFHLGILLARNYQKFLQFNKKNLVAFIGILTLLVLNFFEIKESNFYYSAFLFIKAVIGIISFISLVYITKNNFINSTLDYLGKYSYEIYLLHWFTQMPIRVLYQQFHFNYNYLVIVSFFTAFLVIPISQYIINRSSIFSKLLLGKFNKRRMEYKQSAS